MVGWICSSTTPYYDVKIGHNAFKQRPVLIIGGLISNDYTALPISTVTKRENLHFIYDIKVEPILYPRLKLNKDSFIRVHKQTIIHQAAISYKISNLKTEYPDLYLLVLERLSEYNANLVNKAK